MIGRRWLPNVLSSLVQLNLSLRVCLLRRRYRILNSLWVKFSVKRVLRFCGFNTCLSQELLSHVIVGALHLCILDLHLSANVARRVKCLFRLFYRLLINWLFNNFRFDLYDFRLGWQFVVVEFNQLVYCFLQVVDTYTPFIIGVNLCYRLCYHL